MSQPVRVLVVLNGDGLNTSGLSGGAVRTYETIQAWVAAGRATVHAITTAGGLVKLRAFGLDWPVTVLKASVIGTRERVTAYRFISYFISVLHARFAQRKFSEADLVISSSDFFCDTAVAAHLRRNRPALCWIAMVHHLYTEPWKRPGNPIVNWVWYLSQRRSLRRIARQADGAMVYDTAEGDRVRDCLVALGMPTSAIHAMHNGVHQERFAAGPPLPHGSFQALFVGELRPNKGVFDLVPIWREVCRQMPDARLTVVGGGDPALRRKLEAEASAAGLSGKIQFVGPRGGQDLMRSYQVANLFLFPSHEEGWGIVMLEAMAAGLPIVAYDLPAYRRHYTGAFDSVPPFDTAAFARAVVRLARDAAARASLGKLGKDRVGGYTWIEIARRDWDFILQRRGPAIHR